MDRLTPLFQRFPPQAHVLMADVLCGRFEAPLHPHKGHVHWLLEGRLRIESQGRCVADLAEPAVVLVPRDTPHTLVATQGAQLVCATLEFGQQFNNPLTFLQPQIVVVPVAQAPELVGLQRLLHDEAAANRCGKHIAVNQLLQYFLLVVYRYLIRTESLPLGVTKALADPKLLRAITRMHQAPGQAWTLESLADEAGMSRASFASRFKRNTGATPMDYLTDWRMTVAQSLMTTGVPVKQVAREVGYNSPAALTRVFTKKLGLNPREWMQQHAPTTEPQ